jgi:ATP-dependent RNA helicase RhlE
MGHIPTYGPFFCSIVSQPTFSELGLSEPVLQAITEAGYTHPTSIQAQAIPVALSGRDIIGSSQTGTGKTAAFALPIISKLGAPGKLRCLVLEPTRELAAQVEEQILKYGKHTGLRPVLIHGGVGYGKQRQGLEAGADVVIATPGRLLDYISQRTISLKDVEVLVLDEVDRMLDMGFLPDVRRIVEQCPKERQTLFFSATIPPAIQTLASWALREPYEIQVARLGSAAETISHAFYPVAATQREDLLLELMRRTDFKSVMIFTRTRMQADQLAATVKQQGEQYRVAVMHSDIAQKDRTKALQDFRAGEVDIMIATDIAARGLDISGVTHVINYQVPENPEDYVHRIGRTGRAQKDGDAFTLLSAEELPFAESVERLIGKKVERRKLENFNYTYTTLIDDDPRSQARMRQFLSKGKSRGSHRRF